MLTTQKPFRGLLLNKTHPLSRGLVGCWLLNEGAGTTVFDSSGGQHHGSITNSAPWVPSLNGYSIEFSGTNDDRSIDLGLASSANSISRLYAGTEFTMLVWLVLGTTEGKQVVFIDFGVDNKIWFTIDNDGSEKQNIYLGNTTTPGYHNSTTSITRGVLSQIGFTYNNGITFYLNGNPDGTGATTGSLGYSVTTDGQTRFGANTVAANELDANLIYAVIYNRCLSASEVSLIYREPYAMFYHQVPVWNFYVAAGGTTHSLLGSSTGESGEDADLVLSRALVSDKCAASSTAEAIELESTYSLSASCTSQSGASAVEMDALRALVSDSCISVSGTQGVLVEQKTLTASSAGASSASAVEMDATRCLISDDCTSSSGASADLTVVESAGQTESLKGSISGASAVSARWLLQSMLFAGNTQADSTALAGLLRSLVMAGASAGASSISGSLSVSGNWVNIVFQGVEAISGQPVYLIGKYRET